MNPTQKIEPGTYQHFTGDHYQVIAVGHFVTGNGTTETPGEPMVMYHALYQSKNFGRNHYWTRPVDNFIETVEMNGKQVPRFKRIESQPTA